MNDEAVLDISTLSLTDAKEIVLATASIPALHALRKVERGGKIRVAIMNAIDRRLEELNM